uniref:PX domain-containing protein n=1 Tax=Prolemur simus TaxID=1328070 RepID=A0A8C9AIG0_PROSS
MDMNSFSPMMPTSPLSMTNQIKFEDEPDLEDLFIMVDEPKSSVTTMDTFITYKMITKTSRGELDSREFEVRGRYEDFLWSKGQLEDTHPTLTTPPPRKLTVRETVDAVMRTSLGHAGSDDFTVFVTAQARELSSHRTAERDGANRAVASSMRGVKNRPELFMEMNNFIEIFSKKISLIDEISQRIYKEVRHLGGKRHLNSVLVEIGAEEAFSMAGVEKVVALACVVRAAGLWGADAPAMDMNSFSPMMPTSPLSMTNQIKFEDEPDLEDLFIMVDEPKSRVTTMDTFITYRMITKTSRGELDSREFEVRGRYKDFLWLKGQLEDAHPTLMTPPPPGKLTVREMVDAVMRTSLGHAGRHYRNF